jgi:hypothetical protein
MAYGKVSVDVLVSKDPCQVKSTLRMAPAHPIYPSVSGNPDLTLSVTLFKPPSCGLCHAPVRPRSQPAQSQNKFASDFCLLNLLRVLSSTTFFAMMGSAPRPVQAPRLRFWLEKYVWQMGETLLLARPVIRKLFVVLLFARLTGGR